MLPSLLLMLPIVVVDVGGERLDQDHTRALVGKELNVEAVAADDPRAADATSRIEITSKDGKLTVRYRKVDGPIERSVPMPSDPARAEIDAAYLAGNLARDEASELLPTAPAKPAKPAPASVATTFGEDDRRYAQLRAYVDDLSEESRATSFRAGMLVTGAGALLLTPAIYITAKGDLDDPSDGGLAIASYASGGVLLVIGVVGMIAKADAYEPLVKVVREQDAKKASSDEAIEAVEGEWKRQVAAEQSARHTSAIISFVMAGLALGVGTTLLATNADVSTGWITYIMAEGAVNVLFGVGALVTEGPMERSHRQWQHVSNAAAPTVGFGIAPTVGGGTASFAIRF